jgi:uncharacterized protein (DUF2336 family)
MSGHPSLIAELEDAITNGSQEKRVDTLRRVTDLFLRDADRLSEEQIGVFDDVLIHLTKRIETKALCELSSRLAPIGNAPPELIHKLARDDKITVAGPVLTQSTRLSGEDLIEIAQTKGQEHLLAISGRPRLEEKVTDQLLGRGGREVQNRLAENAGARFSERGFSILVKGAETDENLAKRIGSRLDLPLQVLRELLLRATEAVRDWLMSHAPPEARQDIQRVLATISNEITEEATIARDFTLAEQQVTSMEKAGTLNEEAVLEFATTGQYELLVAGLSALCGTSIQLMAALMRSNRSEGLLVACKAAGLKWPTVNVILKERFTHQIAADQDILQAKKDYIAISQASAHRTLRFWQVRAGASNVNR